VLVDNVKLLNGEIVPIRAEDGWRLLDSTNWNHMLDGNLLSWRLEVLRGQDGTTLVYMYEVGDVSATTARGSLIPAGTRADTAIDHIRLVASKFPFLPDMVNDLCDQFG